ncbi:MAG: hypothetical protein ILO10_00615 [Kiritimatiellae bacterium]|nr:hypothetical protein [Kiritimatiellia bacterium]
MVEIVEFHQRAGNRQARNGQIGRVLPFNRNGYRQVRNHGMTKCDVKIILCEIWPLRVFRKMNWNIVRRPRSEIHASLWMTGKKCRHFASVIRQQTVDDVLHLHGFRYFLACHAGSVPCVNIQTAISQRIENGSGIVGKAGHGKTVGGGTVNRVKRLRGIGQSVKNR